MISTTHLLPILPFNLEMIKSKHSLLVWSLNNWQNQLLNWIDHKLIDLCYAADGSAKEMRSDKSLNNRTIKKKWRYSETPGTEIDYR